jgi:hypothetical protein
MKLGRRSPDQLSASARRMREGGANGVTDAELGAFFRILLEAGRDPLPPSPRRISPQEACDLLDGLAKVSGLNGGRSRADPRIAYLRLVLSEAEEAVVAEDFERWKAVDRALRSGAARLEADAEHRGISTARMREEVAYKAVLSVFDEAPSANRKDEAAFRREARALARRFPKKPTIGGSRKALGLLKTR